jgi:hypothetical protein
VLVGRRRSPGGPGAPKAGGAPRTPGQGLRLPAGRDSAGRHVSPQDPRQGFPPTLLVFPLATMCPRRRGGRVVRQGPAKPCTPVRFRSAPLPACGPSRPLRSHRDLIFDSRQPHSVRVRSRHDLVAILLYDALCGTVGCPCSGPCRGSSRVPPAIAATASDAAASGNAADARTSPGRPWAKPAQRCKAAHGSAPAAPASPDLEPVW